jgi:predicted Zn-dependent peptidase
MQTAMPAVAGRWRGARLLVALVLLVCGVQSPAQGGAFAQTPNAGMLATLSATYEAPSSGGQIVIRISLDNQTGMDLSGLSVSGRLPQGTRIPDLDRDKAGPTLVTDGSIFRWDGLTLNDGARLAPLVIHLVTQPETDGALLFRNARVEPLVSWSYPAPGMAQTVVLPLDGLWGDADLRRTVLPTGLTVLTRERPDTETVMIRAAVRAGARDEDDTTHGGSHWLEHGYFLGTTSRPTAQEIAGQIDNVGGQQNAGTSFEWTDYWHLVPADQFDLAVDSLADMLLNATFPQQAFDRERMVVFEEIRRSQDNPSSRAIREFYKLVFEVSPLQRDVLGPIERVMSIPIETILAYRDERYVTGNMAVAAVGKLTHDEAVARIAAAFAELPRGPRAERPPTPEPVQTAPRRAVVGEGTRVAELRLGWPAPGDGDADAPAVHIIEDILGETGRRLTEEIRERRSLVTSVSPGYAAFSDAGAFLLAATTQPEREQAVIDALLAEIQRLRDGDVTDEEVRASVRAISGRRALFEEMNSAQSTRARSEVSGTAESFAEFLARLNTVTAADVQRVARTYFDPENYTLVIVRA